MRIILVILFVLFLQGCVSLTTVDRCPGYGYPCFQEQIVVLHKEVKL